MTHPREWLSRYGLRFIDLPDNIPAMMYEDEIIQAEHWHTRLINTPTLESYVPPVEPGDWRIVKEWFRQSALAVVHELWTQLLCSHLDKREKPIYLFWDEAIPVPNEQTILFWLMVCESWPMLASHEESDAQDLNGLFPPQSIVLPSSGHRLHATQYPSEFVAPTRGVNGLPLENLLNLHMTREDREKMNLMDFGTRVYRPQEAYIHYWSQTTESSQNRWPRNWHEYEGWPTVPMARFDSGIATFELRSSWWHLTYIQELRQDVMRFMITHPGMPTCYDSLYVCPGGWLRQFAESALMVQPSAIGSRHWSPDNDSIALDGGAVLKLVPPVFPRVWFGWTHIGPKFEIDKDGQPKRILSASEIWVREYLRHRPAALQLLFKPVEAQGRIITERNISEHSAGLAKRLQRAGRLSKAKQANASFADAFRSVTLPKKDLN